MRTGWPKRWNRWRTTPRAARLVHRRLRHRGPAGGEGAARRVRLKRASWQRKQQPAGVIDLIGVFVCHAAAERSGLLAYTPIQPRLALIQVHQKKVDLHIKSTIALLTWPNHLPCLPRNAVTSLAGWLPSNQRDIGADGDAYCALADVFAATRHRSCFVQDSWCDRCRQI